MISGIVFVLGSPAQSTWPFSKKVLVSASRVVACKDGPQICQETIYRAHSACSRGVCMVATVDNLFFRALLHQHFSLAYAPILLTHLKLLVQAHVVHQKLIRNFPPQLDHAVQNVHPVKITRQP